VQVGVLIVPDKRNASKVCLAHQDLFIEAWALGSFLDLGRRRRRPKSPVIIKSRKFDLGIWLRNASRHGY
jgi:hypothetical protein